MEVAGSFRNKGVNIFIRIWKNLYRTMDVEMHEADALEAFLFSLVGDSSRSNDENPET